MFDKKWMFDVDESLLISMPQLLDFYNGQANQSKRNFKIEDVFCYELWTVLGISQEESVKQVLAFYETKVARELPAVPGAIELVKRVKEKVAITARPHHTKELTEENLALRFGNYAPKVLFSIPYTPLLSRNGSLGKAELCLREEVEYALEDSLEQAEKIAHAGIEVFLLNRPWNIRQKANNEKITRINSINEIL